MRTKGVLVTLVLSAVCFFPQVSLADDDACGSATTTDDVISTTTFDILVSCNLTLTTGHTHRCAATACADAAAPGGTNNDYRFVISTAAGGPGNDTAWERSVELNDNPGIDDADSVPVCTTRFLTLGSGTVTIYWMARKEAAADANMTVLDSSLSVVCTDGI